ncbi:MAG: sigma-70 family RNA polymerase sigma factor [Pseudomonadota bacterium]
MAKSEFTDQDARSSREQWFRYLDAIEPLRKDLHAYCYRLTQTVWDAEDLVQDTLLKGFGMTARGDLHGDQSPVKNAKAYLFRVATNQWIDQKRKAHREILRAALDIADERSEADVSPAVEKAIQLTSPQEFATFVLKEGYDFSIREIADFVGTTSGAIKSSLSRSRHKLTRSETNVSADSENRLMAKKFADAINRQDLDEVLALMAESMSIVVCNVGGGRGRSEIWTEKSVRRVEAKYAEYQGEALVLLFDKSGIANDVVRIESSGGQIIRVTDYCYAPETLSHVAEALGVEMVTAGYHQPESVLTGMIATTTLPWRLLK